MIPEKIEKVLSANDTGKTGGHMAGILVPKDPLILGFFPKLDPEMRNPRVILDVTDETGFVWVFKFIYYNNIRFGGTRNEYRLTGMTAFLRAFNLKPGDSVIFQRLSKNDCISVLCKYTKEYNGMLIPSGTWRIIEST